MTISICATREESPVDTAKTDVEAAALEFLTGPARGTATWLGSATLDVSLHGDRLIEINEPGVGRVERDVVARLHRLEDTYEIEARDGGLLWINGERVTAKRLEHRDLIEFGDAGPLARFQLYRNGTRIHKSVGDILNDCIDYTRVSRQPMAVRVGRAARDLVGSFAGQTTLLFRISVVAAIVFLAAISYLQLKSTAVLQEQVDKEALRLESFASALTRARQEALRPSDLNALRDELGLRLSAASERLAALEQRSGASARVVAAAMPSVVFLQGSYGFRETATGRMLRHIVDDQGRMLFSPLGQPGLTLEGDGPVAERQFTGTAFVVNEAGALLTNRHVALPWDEDASVGEFAEQGLEPVLIRFIGYLPDITEPFTVELVKASDELDLALLQCSGVTSGIPYLELADSPPEPGAEVIVMGYPTGLKAMLAQTGEAFIEQLQASQNLEFWAVAELLSKERYIRPLASRGIVAQVTTATVLYDAETTHGGSGGPVLDTDGKVIAVNTAILPEYGGSNIGIPAEHARRLLEEAGVQHVTLRR